MNPADHRNTRIFQEPPDELDEYWTNGVLVGGMASEPDSLEVARAYVRAAGALIPTAIESKEAWGYAYPIFYLYRHSLELYLKALVRPEKLAHDLNSLVQRAAGIAAWQLNRPFSDGDLADLLAFAEIDPNEQGFRYTTKRDGKANILPGEYWVPLQNLRARMEDLSATLDELCRARDRLK